MEKVRANLMLCAGTGCVASGTMKVKETLQEELKKRGLAEEIKIVLTGCNGYCAEHSARDFFSNSYETGKKC